MNFLNSEITATVPVPGSVNCLYYPLKLKEIHIRDPFILNYGGTYILYKSSPDGVSCHVSRDLENWSESFHVYRDGDADNLTDRFWAPEVHFYKGHYYLITSAKAKTKNARDVIFIAKSVSPFGRFIKIASFPLENKDVIDGTLWIENDTPYLVYSRCFTTEEDGIGKIEAVGLSDDLTGTAGTPFTLFKADDPCWTNDRVAEAPFMFSSNGKLYMIWSNYENGYYVVGLSESDNGKLTGNWSHGKTPLYAKNLKKEWVHDGGHPMIFMKNDHTFAMTFHTPNGCFLKDGDPDKDIPETAALFNVTETENGIEIESF